MNCDIDRIIGVIDPDKVQCSNCNIFLHHTNITHVGLNDRFSFDGSTDKFTQWLRHRGFTWICSHCLHMLRDVYIQGFHDGESNAMRNLQRESDRINKSRITWQDNMVEYKKTYTGKRSNNEYNKWYN